MRTVTMLGLALVVTAGACGTGGRSSEVTIDGHTFGDPVHLAVWLESAIAHPSGRRVNVVTVEVPDLEELS